MTRQEKRDYLIALHLLSDGELSREEDAEFKHMKKLQCKCALIKREKNRRKRDRKEKMRYSRIGDPASLPLVPD